MQDPLVVFKVRQLHILDLEGLLKLSQELQTFQVVCDVASCRLVTHISMYTQFHFLCISDPRKSIVEVSNLVVWDLLRTLRDGGDDSPKDLHIRQATPNGSRNRFEFRLVAKHSNIDCDVFNPNKIVREDSRYEDVHIIVSSREVLVPERLVEIQNVIVGAHNGTVVLKGIGQWVGVIHLIICDGRSCELRSLHNTSPQVCARVEVARAPVLSHMNVENEALLWTKYAGLVGLGVWICCHPELGMVVIDSGESRNTVGGRPQTLHGEGALIAIPVVAAGSWKQSRTLSSLGIHTVTRVGPLERASFRIGEVRAKSILPWLYRFAWLLGGQFPNTLLLCHGWSVVEMLVKPWGNDFGGRGCDEKQEKLGTSFDAQACPTVLELKSKVHFYIF